MMGHLWVEKMRHWDEIGDRIIYSFFLAAKGKVVKIAKYERWRR